MKQIQSLRIIRKVDAGLTRALAKQLVPAPLATLAFLTGLLSEIELGFVTAPGWLCAQRYEKNQQRLSRPVAGAPSHQVVLGNRQLVPSLGRRPVVLTVLIKTGDLISGALTLHSHTAGTLLGIRPGSFDAIQNLKTIGVVAVLNTRIALAVRKKAFILAVVTTLARLTG